MSQPAAAKAVLLEVVNVLGAFREDLVIVGGWVPELTYPGRNHLGSLDVDLAVSPRAFRPDAYSSIHARLTAGGYSREENPTRYYRAVAGAEEPVKVDLITGQYVLEEKTAAVQVNELQISGLRGLDLAFEHATEITLTGTMPDGSFNTVRARIVKPEAFLLIKAFALAERLRAKDAYDIAFVLRHYQPSLKVLAERLRPMVAAGLGAEALQNLEDKFSHLDALGPESAAKVASEAGGDLQQSRQAA